MLLDSAEVVLSIFGFNRSLFGFDEKKSRHWWDEIYQQRERDIETARIELYRMSLFPTWIFPYLKRRKLAYHV
jgi:hypothetical protein